MALKNNHPNSASLIISVYKNTADLDVLLTCLQQQSVKNFEIIISEDGNSKEMETFVKQYNSGFTIQHLTQEDAGWQKNRALNNAIQATKTPYIIFIDGDCILHRQFIRNHLRFAKKDRILAGKRVKLGEKYSELLRKNRDVIGFEKTFKSQFGKIRKDGATFMEEGFYIQESPLAPIASLRTMKQLKGCNFSCYKEALLAVNGFDEDYVKPAIGEDIDITWRFKAAGYSLFSLRNRAVQYHLYHKENWTNQEENLAIMAQKMKERAFFCENGIIKK